MDIRLFLLVLLIIASVAVSYSNGLTDGRQKRSFWRTFRVIFKDAKLIEQNPKMKTYYKHGGFQRARDEFDSLKPKIIHDYGPYDKVGMVGNARVDLTEMDGLPAIVLPGRTMEDGFRPYSTAMSVVVYR